MELVVEHRSQQNLVFSSICRSLAMSAWSLVQGSGLSGPFKNLEMVPCDTPVMATISNWACPSRDNLTIIGSITGVI